LESASAYIEWNPSQAEGFARHDNPVFI